MATDPARTRIAIIHNPTAGRRRQALLRRVVAVLEGAGASCRVLPTTGPEDACRIASTLSSADHDVVVAAGGDGTINEVTNGLLRADRPPPLALLPLGTVNVLAMEIGLAPAAEVIAATILHGRLHTVRPATANGRAFLLMAGVGFDAWVVHRVSRRLKRLLGRFAYVWQSMLQCGLYPYPSLQVDVDGRRFEARMVILCKSRLYGGRFVAAPEARLDAETVDVCLLGGAGFAAQARYALALLRGTLGHQPDVTIVRGRCVTVGADAPLPVQIDGDDAQMLPLVVAPAPRPLEILLPVAGLR